MNIRFATNDDRDELLEMLYTTFLQNWSRHPRFEHLFPDIFDPAFEEMPRHMLVIEDGRIASCVGAYPMKMRVAGCDIPFAAIGQVSVHPDFRGRGFMTELLKRQLALMRDDLGIPLAWLGGRNDRYQTFGFAPCAITERIALDAHCVARTGRGIACKRSRALPEHALTEEEFAARDGEILVESRARWEARLRRGACELWRPADANAPKAWVLANMQGNTEEWGGDPDTVVDILYAIAKERGNATVAVSSAEKTLAPRLRRNAHWISFGGDQLCVLNGEKLLAAYAPYLASRGITDLAAARPAAPDGDPELARLCFGPSAESLHLPWLIPGFAHA